MAKVKEIMLRNLEVKMDKRVKINSLGKMKLCLSSHLDTHHLQVKMTRKSQLVTVW